MDTTDDIEIIEEKINVSALKKKKGRLRGPPPKIVPAKVVPKIPPKPSPRKRVPRSSQFSSGDAEKQTFSIPEGFLEILSNAQSDKQTSKPVKTPRARSRIENLAATPSQQSSDGESSAPIKRSRRIQEQHQKKISELAVEIEREQRMLEQLAKKNTAKKLTPQKPVAVKPPTDTKSPRRSRLKLPMMSEEDTIGSVDSKRTPRKSRSRNAAKMALMFEEDTKSSEFSNSRDAESKDKKRRRRGRPSRKGGTGHRPWDVSSESSDTVEEITEEEEEEEEQEEPLIFEVNEDEFACEEIDENAEPVFVRRARTAKKASEDVAAEETVINDDTPCIKCGKYDRPEWILLCDKCDSGYHTTCLIPPLLIIPDGDWYCQPCEHMFLCECLQKELHNLELLLKQKEREELRKQRLAYVGISLDNVLKPEKKEKSESSKSEDDDDDDDDGEVKEEKEVRSKPKARNYKEVVSSEDERHKKIYGQRSVRARRTVNYQFKEYDELIASAIQEDMLVDGVPLEEEFKDFPKDEDDADSEKSFKSNVRPKRKRKSRKLNDLDFTDDDDSGDEYKGQSTDSEHTPPPSTNESGAESAASGEWRIVKTRGKKQRRKPRRGRRGGYSSEEDWEEEENESDGYRPVTRRAAQKTVSYREISSDDEEWNASKPKLPKKRKKPTSSEEDSESSFKKKPAKRKSRVRKWASSESSESENVSFKGSDSSQGGSEDEWKIKKSYEGSRLKININKKVLSSESEEESSSQESASKKKAAKTESEEESEEEEEDDEEEEEEDESSSAEEEESEEEVEKSKVTPEAKPLLIKETSKVAEPVKKPDPPTPSKVISVPPEKTTDAVKVSVPSIAAVARDKPPLRTIKKDATKMVPCVIPYEKSPKSAPATTPDEESDKDSKAAPFTKSASASQSMSKNTLTQSGSESRPFVSTIMEPFSNMDEESEDSVPLERIPTSVPPSVVNKPRAFEQEYIPAKEFAYTAPEEKSFPPSYSSLAPFADFSSRPSPLKPSLVETYSNNSSPSKLTPLDTTSKQLTPLDNPSKFTSLDNYSRSNSPRGFVNLDYSEGRKKKHFYGSSAVEEPRTVHPPADSYQGEIRFPPEPYPCPQSPNSYTQRSSPHVQRDPGTPPRFHSQYPDSYAPPRSPEYYQSHQYYGGEERIPRPPYQPNYVPPEQGAPYVPNPYVATPVPQPNGGFMIDSLLQGRNPEDELTEVTDIVSYITQEK